MGAIRFQNVDGLKGEKKKLFINALNTTKDIVIALETHLAKPDLNLSKMDGSVIQNPGTDRSAGIIIATKNKEIVITNVVHHVKGRSTSFLLESDGEKTLVFVIYAPNVPSDQLEFYETLLESIAVEDAKNLNTTLMILGDFNFTMKPKIDRSTKNDGQSHSRSREKIIEILATYNLKDLWRTLHEKIPGHTFSRADKSSRIDMFLVSSCLVPKIHELKIGNGVGSDHFELRMVYTPLENIERGPGSWKFNTSMLQDKKFREVTMKNKLIQEKMIARRDILSPLCQMEYILKKCRPFIARHGQERNKLRKQQLEAWKEELEELLNREDL